MSVVIEMQPSAASICTPEPGPASSRQIAPVERTRWKSGLSPSDLQCLLSVIEGELLPRLLTEYSPARHAPLGARGSSG